jgi:hypothetical protein
VPDRDATFFPRASAVSVVQITARQKPLVRA